MPGFGPLLMNSFLLELRNDHHHMMRIVRLIRYAAEMPEGDPQEPGVSDRLELLQECIGYMQNYPEIRHHPIEDVIFDCLVARDPAASQYTSTLQDEHRVLADLNRGILASINDFSQGSDQTIERISSQAIAFADLQIRHMRIEESTVFPLANRKLTLADWKQVIEKSGQLPDPKSRDELSRRLEENFQQDLDGESQP